MDTARPWVAVLRWILLGLALLWAAFPILFMIRGSLKPPAEIWDYPPSLGGTFTLVSYQEVFANQPQFLMNMVNSLLSTLLGVVATIVIAFAAAYVFSRLRSGWLRLPAMFILTIRMFPPIVVIIPLYPVLNAIGLLDTLAPLVIAGTAFAVCIATLLLKAFIDDIPIELEEAAMIDGCTRFQAFCRITVPLVAPGVAAVVVFVAIAMWNEYLFPLVFTSTNARTAPVAIAIAINNTEGVRWGALLAVSTLHLLPMLILVMLLHKRLVQGMTMGAIKG